MTIEKKVKIRILDEVWCILVGLKGEDHQTLYDRYAVNAANYFFNPKYKLGQWDGKIRYFHDNGKTYIFLLDEILPSLVKMGYKVDIEDLRTTHIVHPKPITEDVFADILHMDTGQPIKVRDYQVNMVNALIEHGYGLALASTGSGKTLTMAALVKTYNDEGIKTLTIVPNQDLIRQTKSEYINCRLDTGEYSGKEKTLNHMNVVSTWQALKNNPKVVNGFDMIIVDECLDENTMILMEDGTQKRIKDVKASDRVISYNTITGTFEHDEVEKLHTNLSISSQEKMYRLEFDDGTVLDVTGNHKILTTRGYVRADELTFEDTIISNRKT